MTPADPDGEALAALLATIAADRAARCAALIAEADAAAAALLAEAHAAARRRLRTTLAAARQAAQARLAVAAARLAAAQRQRQQRLAGTAVDAGWALLAPALQRCWQEPQCRRRWLEAALQAARRNLPGGGWRLRHPADLAAAERDWLSLRLAELGVDAAQYEAAAENTGCDAGLEIVAGNARCDATVAGLLGDRAAVAGRLLYLWQAAP